MINLKFKKETIYEFFLLFFTFHLCFINFPYLSFHSTIKYVLALIVGLLIALRLPVFLKTVRRMDIIILLYIVCILISGFINSKGHVITNTILNSFAFVLSIIECIFVFEYMVLKKSMYFLAKMFSYILLAYVLLNDILLFLAPQLFVTKSTYYLVGNKFAVAFVHILLLIFLSVKHRMENNGKRTLSTNIMHLALILLALVISIRVDCMTGVMAVMIYVVLNIIPSRLFESPIVLLLVAVFAVSFVTVFQLILTNNFVSDFIVNTLNRDLTLTGRTNIYPYIPVVLKDHLLFGYGYGTSYETWTSLVYFIPNSQNGLLDNIVETGLLATVLFTIYALWGVRRFKHSNPLNKKVYLPLIIVLYIYLIISSIEISTGFAYCAIAILLNTCSKSKFTN